MKLLKIKSCPNFCRHTHLGTKIKIARNTVFKKAYFIFFLRILFSVAESGKTHHRRVLPYFMKKEAFVMSHTSHDTFTDLPASCRAAADRMENALRAENSCGCGSGKGKGGNHYCTASITDECNQKIDALEKEISKTCGKNIVLVAYQEQ